MASSTPQQIIPGSNTSPPVKDGDEDKLLQNNNKDMLKDMDTGQKMEGTENDGWKKLDTNGNNNEEEQICKTFEKALHHPLRDNLRGLEQFHSDPVLPQPRSQDASPSQKSSPSNPEDISSEEYASADAFEEPAERQPSKSDREKSTQPQRDEVASSADDTPAAKEEQAETSPPEVSPPKAKEEQAVSPFPFDNAVAGEPLPKDKYGTDASEKPRKDKSVSVKNIEEGIHQDDPASRGHCGLDASTSLQCAKTTEYHTTASSKQILNDQSASPWHCSYITSIPHHHSERQCAAVASLQTQQTVSCTHNRNASVQFETDQAVPHEEKNAMEGPCHHDQELSRESLVRASMQKEQCNSNTTEIEVSKPVEKTTEINKSLVRVSMQKEQCNSNTTDIEISKPVEKTTGETSEGDGKQNDTPPFNDQVIPAAESSMRVRSENIRTVDDSAADDDLPIISSVSEGSRKPNYINRNIRPSERKEPVGNQQQVRCRSVTPVKSKDLHVAGQNTNPSERHVRRHSLPATIHPPDLHKSHVASRAENEHIMHGKESRKQPLLKTNSSRSSQGGKSVCSKDLSRLVSEISQGNQISGATDQPESITKISTSGVTSECLESIISEIVQSHSVNEDSLNNKDTFTKETSRENVKSTKRQLHKSQSPFLDTSHGKDAKELRERKTSLCGSELPSKVSPVSNQANMTLDSNLTTTDSDVQSKKPLHPKSGITHSEEQSSGKISGNKDDFESTLSSVKHLFETHIVSPSPSPARPSLTCARCNTVFQELESKDTSDAVAQGNKAVVCSERQQPDSSERKTNQPKNPWYKKLPFKKKNKSMKTAIDEQTVPEKAAQDNNVSVSDIKISTSPELIISTSRPLACTKKPGCDICDTTIKRSSTMKSKVKTSAESISQKRPGYNESRPYLKGADDFNDLYDTASVESRPIMYPTVRGAFSARMYGETMPLRYGYSGIKPLGYNVNNYDDYSAVGPPAFDSGATLDSNYTYAEKRRKPGTNPYSSEQYSYAYDTSHYSLTSNEEPGRTYVMLKQPDDISCASKRIQTDPCSYDSVDVLSSGVTEFSTSAITQSEAYSKYSPYGPSSGMPSTAHDAYSHYSPYSVQEPASHLGGQAQALRAGYDSRMSSMSYHETGNVEPSEYASMPGDDHWASSQYDRTDQSKYFQSSANAEPSEYASMPGDDHWTDSHYDRTGQSNYYQGSAEYASMPGYGTGSEYHKTGQSNYYQGTSNVEPSEYGSMPGYGTGSEYHKTGQSNYYQGTANVDPSEYGSMPGYNHGTSLQYARTDQTPFDTKSLGYESMSSPAIAYQKDPSYGGPPSASYDPSVQVHDVDGEDVDDFQKLPHLPEDYQVASYRQQVKAGAEKFDPLYQVHDVDVEDVDDFNHAFEYTYKKEPWKGRGSGRGTPSQRTARAQKSSSLDRTSLFRGELAGELTEMGRYSFFTLVAVALNTLYENEACDRKFIEGTLKQLGTHLRLSGSVVGAGMTIARGEGLDDTHPFVSSLKEEAVVKLFGLEVLLFDFLQLILRRGVYDSRDRTLVRFLSGVMLVDWGRITQYESYLVDTFMEEEHQMTEEEKLERHEKEKKQKFKKYAMIGAATVGGGALLGLTGGLAAPLIAAGAGVLVGGAGAAALGSMAGIYLIGSLFGVAGAGLAGYKMNKRVGDLEEFEFETLTEGRQLHITLAISGWLTEENPDFHSAWLTLDNSDEQYVLRYESKYLTQVGSAMDYIVDMAMKSAGIEALKYTVLSGLVAAISWPAALISASSIIDNPWSVLMNRSNLAGKQLANVLLARHQGKRPVTLIGFSSGARVIYYCLQEMATRKNCEGIVEEAILLGAPVPNSASQWSRLRKVVSGRIINGYCRGDWLLKFLYRTASAQYSIAGLDAIDWRDRRMHNIDLTHIVTGHMDYMNRISDILDIIGLKIKYKDEGQRTLADYQLPSVSSSRATPRPRHYHQGAAVGGGVRVGGLLDDIPEVASDPLADPALYPQEPVSGGLSSSYPRTPQAPSSRGTSPRD